MKIKKFDYFVKKFENSDEYSETYPDEQYGHSEYDSSNINVLAKFLPYIENGVEGDLTAEEINMIDDYIRENGEIESLNTSEYFGTCDICKKRGQLVNCVLIPHEPKNDTIFNNTADHIDHILNSDPNHMKNFEQFKISLNENNSVIIPDSNFLNFLIKAAPEIFNEDGQLDVDSPAIKAIDRLYLGDLKINSLEGIQYFTGLVALNCIGNNIKSIRILPDTIKTLNISDNPLIKIEKLPSEIVELDCSKTKLINLPELPSNLKHLNCYKSNIKKLPLLPNSLISINCYNNKLSALPTLPDNLETLICSHNAIRTLPNLPSNLKCLICTDNLLTSLPVLPNSLDTLRCDSNKLTDLPTLPPNIKRVTCTNNYIRNLPTKPDYIKLHLWEFAWEVEPQHT